MTYDKETAKKVQEEGSKSLKELLEEIDEMGDMEDYGAEFAKYLEDQHKAWEEAKEQVKDLIHPKYIEFIETHDSYVHEGFVNVVEIAERTPGYKTFPHYREFGTDNNKLVYIRFITTLESHDGESEYEGEEIEYLVWQTVGYCEDDYSGYLLLPLNDGRYWKISYSC